MLRHGPKQFDQHSLHPPQGVVQAKTSAPGQIRQPPAAPPVYRPQPAPKILQTKTLFSGQQINQSARVPLAPPVYRPQPMPRVLQTKFASGQQSPAAQPFRPPIAPAVYRPEQTKILQPKTATPVRPGNPPQAPSIHFRQLHKTVRPPSNSGVVQRITFNAVNIDIGTLNLGDSRTHLGRLRRLRGQLAAQPPVAPAIADVGYVYAQGDEDALRQRIANLEAVELENRRLAVVADLTQQIGALATVNDHTVQPPWAVNTPAGASNEVIGQGTLAPNVVVARWQTFLQAGAYSHKHPRTGGVDDTRLVAADGQRSIRYGDHEKNSTANLHHFHEETWTHDNNANTVSVANVVRRVPVT